MVTSKSLLKILFYFVRRSFSTYVRSFFLDLSVSDLICHSIAGTAVFQMVEDVVKS